MTTYTSISLSTRESTGMRQYAQDGRLSFEVATDALVAAGKVAQLDAAGRLIVPTAAGKFYFVESVSPVAGPNGYKVATVIVGPAKVTVTCDTAVAVSDDLTAATTGNVSALTATSVANLLTVGGKSLSVQTATGKVIEMLVK